VYIYPTCPPHLNTSSHLS